MNPASSATAKYGPNRPNSGRMARWALRAVHRRRQPPRRAESPVGVAPRRRCRRWRSSELVARTRRLASRCSRLRPRAC